MKLRYVVSRADTSNRALVFFGAIICNLCFLSLLADDGQEHFIIKARFNAYCPSCAGLAIFFYSNEGNEPMHVHAAKGDAECKYWLKPYQFDIIEEFEYNCTPRLRREVRQIIFEHFDQICTAWQEYFGESRAD